MHFIDLVILILVIGFLISIIYFRWLKKDKKSNGCNCYRRKTCELNYEELKNIINPK